MFAEEIRRAVMVAPRSGLPALAEGLWRSYASGAVSESDAQQLAELIEGRKSNPDIVRFTKRIGSRPRSSASLERRRSWAAGSWMPPALAAGFTTAENAALAVIIREIAATGACGLPAAAIAGKAGVSTSSVRNAVREARRRGILHVVERRISYNRSEPNIITIASRELALWVRTRSRAERVGGGVRNVKPTTNLYINSYAKPAATGRKTGLTVRETARFAPERPRRGVPQHG